VLLRVATIFLTNNSTFPNTSYNNSAFNGKDQFYNFDKLIINAFFKRDQRIRLLLNAVFRRSKNNGIKISVQQIQKIFLI